MSRPPSSGDGHKAVGEFLYSATIDGAFQLSFKIPGGSIVVFDPNNGWNLRAFSGP